MTLLKMCLGSIMLALCLISCGSEQPGKMVKIKPTSFNSVNVKEAKVLLEKPVQLLDVRTPIEIADGKITGAREIDFKSPNFESQLDVLNKDVPVLVYCRSGGRSAKTCEILSKKGYKQVYNLEGGYRAWSKY